MESIGTYWKPAFNILEGSGLTILIVNTRHIKYVPGHKIDKKDSAWIAKLLLAGLHGVSGTRIVDTLLEYQTDPTKKREAQLKYYQKRIEELGAKIPETKSV